MKISQSFTVERSRDAVWALFQDVPALAECMPGATLTEDKGDGTYAGQVAIKLGPFTASFEGEAKHVPDPVTHSGHVDGKGIDKRGGSRSRMSMDYALNGEGERTEVTVDADVQLSGPIAQFGRIGVIEETAKLLIGQFVDNIEKRLGTATETPATEASSALGQTATPGVADSLNGLALLRMLIARYFRKIFSGG